MSILLSHLDLMPLFYGVIIILGICVVVIHIATMKIGAALLDVGIFVLVFWMHGGTMTGGMSAAVAALVGGIVIPLIIRHIANRRG
jgi:hypothetical protein